MKIQSVSSIHHQNDERVGIYINTSKSTTLNNVNREEKSPRRTSRHGKIASGRGPKRRKRKRIKEHEGEEDTRVNLARSARLPRLRREEKRRGRESGRVQAANKISNLGELGFYSEGCGVVEASYRRRRERWV